MKKHLVGVALSLGLGLSTGLVAPANAFTPGGTFYLNGPFSVINRGSSLTCTAKFTVSASIPGSPDGDIVAADFGGSTPGLCTVMTGLGLPWHIHYIGSGNVQISGVTLTHPVLGNCGPATLSGTWSNNPFGLLTGSSSLPANCTASWSMTPSPPQSLP